MGTVYLAHDRQLSRQVALKVPRFDADQPDELLQRFYRETRSAALLRSPHICPVYDVGEIDGQHYISMAFIEGRPLSDVIKRNELKSQRQVLLLVRKLALALQLAHEQGIVHRDLKPGNVMIDTHGEPVITDFGLACQLQDASTRLTNSGVILGTPAYMAPEQLEGQSTKITPAADQYSLGVMLYELLTGQLPFLGSFSAPISQTLTKPAPSLRLVRPEIDPRVDALCLQMLAKSPADRLESMRAVASRLATVLKEPPPPEPGRHEPSPVAADPLAETTTPARGIQQQIASLVARGEFEAALERIAPYAERQTGKVGEWAQQQQSEIRDQLARWKQELPGVIRLAAKLIRKHDYAEAAKMLGSVPVGMRTTELNELLQEATDKDEEATFLLKEIESSIRQNQPQELPRLVKRFLNLKPGHKGILSLATDLKLHGAEKVIRLRRSRRHLFDAAGPTQSPVTVALGAFGLIAFCIVAFWIGSLLMAPKGTVVVAVQDPRISLEFANELVTAARSGTSFRVPTNESKSLEVQLDGIPVKDATRQILVKKNEIQRITARLRDGVVELEIVRMLPGAAEPERELVALNRQQPSAPPADSAARVPEEWIDLLATVDVEPISRGTRKWTRGEVGLVGTVNESADAGWVVLVPPHEFQGDYDLEVEYTLFGSDYLQLGLPLNETVATLSIGANGTGLHWIDGRDFNSVDATSQLGNTMVTTRPGTKQRVSASIRHNGDAVSIETALDGQPAGRYAGLRSRVTTPQETAPAARRLKLVTQVIAKQPDTRFEVHSARVKLIPPSATPVPNGASESDQRAEPPLASTDRTVSPPSSPADGRTVLLDVDFRQSDGGFTLQDGDHVLAEHANGEYRYVGKIPGWQCGGLHPALWSVQNNQIENFVAEVDVRIIGAKSGVFGIEFGRVGDDTLTVCLNQAGQIKLIQGYDNNVFPFTASPAMRPVSQFNTIGLSVQDKVVKVTANGAAVFEKKLARYSGGGVILWVGGDEVPFDTRLRRFRLERIGDERPVPLTQEVRRLKGHTDIIRDVEFLPDSRHAVSVGHNKSFKLWDVATGEQLYDFEGHTNHVTSVSVSGDGKRALTGCDDTDVRLWDLEGRTLVRTLKGHSAPVVSVKISRDGLTGLSSSTDGMIRRWSLKPSGKSAVVPSPAMHAVLAVSPAEDVVASGHDNGSVILRNSSGGGSLLGHDPAIIEDIAFTPDGLVLMTASNDGTVRVWDTQNGKQIHRFEATGMPFDSVAVTADGHYVVAGCGDFSIIGWDIESGERVCEIRAEVPVTQRMALSPDNKLMISGGGEWGWRPFGDYDLRLWRVPAPIAPATP